MAGYQQLETDEQRLPYGTQRIGYDADTQTHTFRDADGNTWDSENEYGHETLPHNGTSRQGGRDGEPKCFGDHENYKFWKYMGPWAIIVCVALLLLFRFLPFGGHQLQCNDGLARYIVKKGDTCWNLAESRDLRLDELVDMNSDLDCDELWAGSQICLPEAQDKEDR